MKNPNRPDFVVIAFECQCCLFREQNKEFTISRFGSHV